MLRTFNQRLALVVILFFGIFFGIITLINATVALSMFIGIITFIGLVYIVAKAFDWIAKGE